MKTLDRYLAARMVTTLMKSLVALVMLFILVDLLTHRRGDIMKYDVPWTVTLGYYAALTPWIINQVAPLALLVSALLVLGAAAQHNETVAALAGGVSLWRFVRMPVLVSLLLALSVLLLGETFGPGVIQLARRVDEKYFSSNPGASRKGISWANLAGGWTCHVRTFNSIALTGEDILMYTLNGERLEQIRAHRMFWDADSGCWKVEDGFRAIVEPDDASAWTQRLTQECAPIQEPPEVLFALEQPQDTKTARQLAGEIAAAEARNAPVGRYRVDYHAKFSQPALSFVMIWLAIPFAMRLRRGGVAVGFGLSVAIAITYLMVYWMGMGLGYTGRISPLTAAWLANVVFATTGITLLAKTST